MAQVRTRNRFSAHTPTSALTFVPTMPHRPVNFDACVVPHAVAHPRTADVVPDAGYSISDVLPFLPRAAAACLLSRHSSCGRSPTITAADVDAAHAAAGCRRITRGGGYWHGPRAPPLPLPQLKSHEAPTKSLYICRERDRRRFTAAEFWFRLCAHDDARAAYQIARAQRAQTARLYSTAAASESLTVDDPWFDGISSSALVRSALRQSTRFLNQHRPRRRSRPRPRRRPRRRSHPRPRRRPHLRRQKWRVAWNAFDSWVETGDSGVASTC